MNMSLGQIRADWKFIIMLVVTIAGVAVPVWLWYTDQASHSIQAKLISQTALQPDGVGAVSGLKIFSEGLELKAPYLSILEIKNNGAHAIPAAAFEGPLKIWTNEQTKIVRTQITNLYPNTLQPSITLENNALSLQPLLLNSNESISIGLITTGGSPKFSIRARIENVPPIEIENDMQHKSLDSNFWITATIAFALLVSYSLIMDGLFDTGLTMRPRAVLFTGVTVMSGSALLITPYLVNPNSNFWLNAGKALLIYVVTLIVATPLASYINRRLMPSSSE